MSGIDRFVAEKAGRLVRAASRRTADRARQLKAQGADMLRLSGAPLDLPPEYVLEAARAATRSNVHPPARGLAELRRAIAARLRADSGIQADPETEILVTNGAMDALNIIATGVLNPGDEVLIPAPCFFFGGIIELADGVPVYARLDEGAGFRFDADRFRAAITPRTKVFLLNTPVNPTGYVASRVDLEAVARLAEERDLLVVADESYDRLVYDGCQHVSIGSLPGMSARTITVRSFTKSYSMPQWRMGYVVAPTALIDVFVKVLEWRVLSCNYVAQKAATAALTGPQVWTDQIRRQFEIHRDRLWDGLSQIDGLTCVRPQGGPFFFPNTGAVSDSSEDFAGHLLVEYGLPVDPGHFYQSDRHVRIPFGATDETIEQLIERLAHAVAAYPGARADTARREGERATNEPL